MIAVDTSALVMIALREQGWQGVNEALSEKSLAIGWPTVLEFRISLGAKPPESAVRCAAWISRARWRDDNQFRRRSFRLAEIAFEKFGKRCGHPAQLNFGDCMSYAVARALDAPLLFKGPDFAKTDLRIHPASVAA